MEDELWKDVFLAALKRSIGDPNGCEIQNIDPVKAASDLADSAVAAFLGRKERILKGGVPEKKSDEGWMSIAEHGPPIDEWVEVKFYNGYVDEGVRHDPEDGETCWYERSGHPDDNGLKRMVDWEEIVAWRPLTKRASWDEFARSLRS